MLYDELNPTSVAKWFKSYADKKGYELNFKLDDLELLNDLYLHEIYAGRDKNENHLIHRTALCVYVGETIVLNSNAKWVGEFLLSETIGNYYTSYVEFESGYKVSPLAVVDLAWPSADESPKTVGNVKKVLLRGQGQKE